MHKLEHNLVNTFGRKGQEMGGRRKLRTKHQHLWPNKQIKLGNFSRTLELLQPTSCVKLQVITTSE